MTSSGNQDSKATEYVNTAPSRIVMLVRERRKRSGSGVLEGEGEGEVVTVGLAEVSEVLDGVAERAANTQQVTPGGRAHTHTCTASSWRDPNRSVHGSN